MNFIEVYSSYGSYHNNTINKIIHVVCVPLIIISLYHILHHFTPVWTIYGTQINISSIIAFLMCLAYTTCFRLPGLLSWIYFFLAVISRNQYQNFENKNLHFNISMVVFILSWVFQFIGHGVFQKRKPALTDNIFQVFSAPLFIISQVLFFLGWNKEQKAIIETKISKNIEQFKQKNK